MQPELTPPFVPLATRARAGAVTSLLAVLGVCLVATVGACADQGEGERCTAFGSADAGSNGSTECAAGLTCRATNYYPSVTDYPGSSGALGVCCPPLGTTSSSAACNPTVSGSTSVGPPVGDGSFEGSAIDGGGDAPPPDATTMEATTVDAPAESSPSVDASTEAATGVPDAASDAGVDSSVDGTTAG